jgi:hypothetical protein
MARRKNPDSKKEKDKKNFSREKGDKSIRKSIIIACEDSFSAPTYFKQIIEKLKNDKITTPYSYVFAKHQHTNPTGVLKDLLNTENYTQFDYKWIVIDRDKELLKGSGHGVDDFNKAISEAKKQNVKVAYSNDCFELWYLLHFNYIDTALSRKDLVDKTIEELKKSNSDFEKLNEKSIKNEEMAKKIFKELLPKQDDAIKNSKTLLSKYNPVNPSSNNPSTTIHLLVETLKKM